MIKLQRLLLCTVLSLIVSCNGVEGEEALSENQSTTINKALWNDADLPLQMIVSTQLNAGQVNAVSDTISTWDDSFSGVNFFNPSISYSVDPKHSTLQAYRETSGEVFGVYVVRAGDPLADPSLDTDRALAVTQFYAFVEQSNGEKYYRIIHADIFINERLYDFSTTTDPTTYDFESVMLHEMGHLLGLGHVSFGQGQSVMNPSISKTTEKQELLPVDESNIANNYETSASTAKAQSQSQGAPVRVLTMLMPDGDCKHYEDDKLVHTHHSEADLH